MRIQILSDVHLEFSMFEPVTTPAEVVVLAGDIGKGAQGIEWARSAFPDKHIVYVPGNHEFYGKQRQETLALMRVTARECDVHLLDDDEMVIERGGEAVRFLGCTLWTDFRLFGEGKQQLAMFAGQQSLNDFRVIHEGSLGHFSPAHSIELHERSLAWLERKLAESYAGKTVVVTHHLPSARSVVSRYRQEMLSACFASELDHLFGKMDLWVHGHTHDNLDYEVNGTRVVCNPRGYVTYRGAENFGFDPELTVEV